MSLNWGKSRKAIGADDLLYSCNARPEKALVGLAQWEIKQVILL